MEKKWHSWQSHWQRQRRQIRSGILTWLIWLIFVPGLLTPLVAFANKVEIPPAQNLQAEAAQAVKNGWPLVVLYSREDCGFCRRIKRDHLVHLLHDPAFQHKVVVREISQDKPLPLVDFQGKATQHDKYARKEAINFVPVVAFYGIRGETLAPTLMGARIPDFYQTDLEQAVMQARAEILKGK